MNEQLLKAFKAAKISQGELSRRSEVSQRVIRRWREGGGLTIRTYEKLAKAIGVKIEVKP